MKAWRKNSEFSKRVHAYEGPDAQALKDYYRINRGPWDRLKDFEPFVDNIPHPEGAGFYPEDMTKEEFGSWIAAHPQDKESFQSLYTIIEREKDDLVAVPSNSCRLRQRN